MIAAKPSAGELIAIRISRFARRTLRLMRVLRNWPVAVAAPWTGRPFHCAKLRNGAVLNAPPTLDFAFLFHEIWINRVYSPPAYEIKDGNVVIDIGANMGVFSIYAATSARDVQVYSYEPFPDSVRWLEKNLRSNGLSNVAVYQKAVTGTAGKRSLQVHSSNWILNRLSGDDMRHDGVPVECVTLDDVFMRDQISTCDLLKLDCEGSEHEILRHCQTDTLRRIRRIVGEYHDLGTAAESGAGLRKLLEDRGFLVDRLDSFAEGGGMFYARNVSNEAATPHGTSSR